MPKLPAEAYAIIEGRHSDPFHYLGLHPEGEQAAWCARFFPMRPTSKRWASTARWRSSIASMMPACSSALCRTARSTTSSARSFGDNEVEIEDAYRFPPILTDFDLYLLGEGTHLRLYDELGAHPRTLDGVDGVAFVVWRPMPGASAWSATSMSGTDGVMPCGCAATAFGKSSCPRPGRRQIQIRDHRPARPLLPLKSDPVAFAAELRPQTASIVFDGHDAAASATRSPAPTR